MIDYTNRIVELKADVHTMWRLQCQNLYNSKNLGALAVRECVQNSLDSIHAAIRAHKINRGFIHIDWEGNDLTIEDNGLGMDISTLHDKFLTLGGTTKGDADNVGGFGLAKSVILGCGQGFQVETQDNIFSSNDLGKNPIRKQPFRAGTKITLYDVQIGDNQLIGDDPWEFQMAVEDYIYSSDIPRDVDIRLNGKSQKLYFNPTQKSHRLPAEFNIGSGLIPQNTQLKIDVYKTKSVVKYLYVRLRGLTQFKQYLCWNANSDIVLDIITSIDPRSSDYPFATNREGLKAQYQGIIEAIRDKVSQAPMSIARDNRYKETLYDNINDGSRDQIAVARAVAKEMVSSQVSSTVNEVTKVISSIKFKGGFTPQGGYVPATIADYVQQYNSAVAETAKEMGTTKADILKHVQPDTLFKLNNPLSYSWLIYEDTQYKPPTKLPKSTVVSMVMVWDTILKLMASNVSQLMSYSNFYPGIVSEKKTMGMCLEKFITKDGHSEKRCYVMVNPAEIPEGSYQKIALWLMGVASHELAHFICGSFEAHGETFSYTREAIMNANLDALEDVVHIIEAAALQKLLHHTNIPAKKSVSSNYSSQSLQELEKSARDNGVDVESLQVKYPNSRIYRMRLTMAIKKALG